MQAQCVATCGPTATVRPQRQVPVPDSGAAEVTKVPPQSRTSSTLGPLRRLLGNALGSVLWRLARALMLVVVIPMVCGSIVTWVLAQVADGAWLPHGEGGPANSDHARIQTALQDHRAHAPALSEPNELEQLYHMYVGEKARKSDVLQAVSDAMRGGRVWEIQDVPVLQRFPLGVRRAAEDVQRSIGSIVKSPSRRRAFAGAFRSAAPAAGASSSLSLPRSPSGSTRLSPPPLAFDDRVQQAKRERLLAPGPMSVTTFSALTPSPLDGAKTPVATEPFPPGQAPSPPVAAMGPRPPPPRRETPVQRRKRLLRLSALLRRMGGAA